ncbi:hypothetical protein D1007_00809 [Hordeum vulgare]|nr:hypothetical protein D1007_00809 [Hordeum vulgare]
MMTRWTPRPPGYLTTSRLQGRGLCMDDIYANNYSIELIDGDGLTQDMSQVKCPTPNPSSSTHVDLRQGPPVDPLFFIVKNFPSFIVIEPLFSFLEDTFYGSASASSAAKSDLVGNADADKGTLHGSCNEKDIVHDIREGTLHPCSPKGKDPICDKRVHTRNPCSSNGKDPIYDM